MLRNRKGFTLIEMLVVIAIIAVLVSIIVPSMAKYKIKAAAATDAANLRTVLEEAVLDYSLGVENHEGFVHYSAGDLSVPWQKYYEIPCKSLPNMRLYVDNEGDRILVGFVPDVDKSRLKVYSIEDFARAAEDGKLKATSDMIDKDIGLDDFFK